MRAYLDNGYKYFFDTNLQLWTIFEVNNKGHQIGDAGYHRNREELKENYPELEFEPYEA